MRVIGLLKLGMSLGLAIGFVRAGHAGGSLDGDEPDPNAGPGYYGFVKDANGAVVADAKVMARLRGGTFVTRTDALGAYNIPGFSKEVDPNDVEIACAQEGYKQSRVYRRPTAPAAPAIETDCFLQRQ
jgi:hypothetical protein